MHWGIWHIRTETLQHFQKRCHFLCQYAITSFFRIQPACLIIRAVLVQASDFCQMFRCKTSDRRCQNCRKRDVLPWIVHNPQKRKDRAYFQCRKISASGSGVSRNPHFAEHGQKGFRPAADGTKENNNIAVLCFAVCFLFFIIDQFTPHDLPDLSADHACFCFPCCLIGQRISIQQQHFTAGKR